MNVSEFMKTDFKLRTAKIKVEELAQFFGDEEPVWEVRGMTGEEVARVNASVDRNGKLIEIIQALSGPDNTEKSDALKELLGVSTREVPVEIIRRKEMLVACSISPLCSEELAVKLAQTFPTVFYEITTKIHALTGLGQDPGKPKPSGKSKASAPA